jgi:hypothetical protein
MTTEAPMENHPMIRTKLVALILLIAGAAVAAPGCVVEADETTNNAAPSAAKGNATPSETSDSAATSEAPDIGPGGVDAQGFTVHCCKWDPCDDGNAPICEVN